MIKMVQGLIGSMVVFDHVGGRKQGPDVCKNDFAWSGAMALSGGNCCQPVIF
jgi:hypothetical protein